MTAIEELTFSPRDRRRFVDVEFRLNRDDPVWVPPLRRDRMRYMDPAKNPFFAHADVAHFVARREGVDVGRIAAVHNRLHEELHTDGAGFFGFLESEDAPDTVSALLDAAAARLREWGRSSMRGPVSYDTNEVSGMLVSGFDDPPTVMMPYNRPYLPRHVEAAGLAKSKDLLALLLKSDALVDRIRKLSDRVRKREGISVRTFRKDRFREEVEIVKRIYNRAWEANWGFVPLTDEEIDFKADDLKQILHPEFVLFGTVDGREVAFAMTLPDANQALRGVRSGRLFPTGLIRILLAWRRINRLRIVTLGTEPEYRNRGLEILFYRELFDRALRLGYLAGECSWILEDNRGMLKGLEVCGARETKRYRIYERAL